MECYYIELFLYPFPTFGGMSDTEQNEQETDFTMCAPMGECAVNTIIRTKVTTLMASRMANIVHSHSNTSMLPMAIQTDISLHMLPFVYLTAIPTRLLA